MHPPKIAITGFMCSGKTTVGRALGQLLGCKVIDLDEAIVESEGRNAANIIEHDGENAFRETETRVLARLLPREGGAVISLGGGTWTVAENRRLLAEHGYRIVWLDAPFELCWARIQDAGEKRPLAVSYEAAQKRYQERLNIYELADARVEIKDDDTVEDVAIRIVASVLRDRENS